MVRVAWLDPADHRRAFEAELHAVAVMEAIYRSSASGRWETVPAA